MNRASPLLMRARIGTSQETLKALGKIRKIFVDGRRIPLELLWPVLRHHLHREYTAGESNILVLAAICLDLLSRSLEGIDTNRSSRQSFAPLLFDNNWKAIFHWVENIAENSMMIQDIYGTPRETHLLIQENSWEFIPALLGQLGLVAKWLGPHHLPFAEPSCYSLVAAMWKQSIRNDDYWSFLPLSFVLYASIEAGGQEVRNGISSIMRSSTPDIAKVCFGSFELLLNSPSDSRLIDSHALRVCSLILADVFSLPPESVAPNVNSRKNAIRYDILGLCARILRQLCSFREGYTAGTRYDPEQHALFSLDMVITTVRGAFSAEDCHASNPGSSNPEVLLQELLEKQFFLSMFRLAPLLEKWEAYRRNTPGLGWEDLFDPLFSELENTLASRTGRIHRLVRCTLKRVQYLNIEGFQTIREPKVPFWESWKRFRARSTVLINARDRFLATVADRCDAGPDCHSLQPRLVSSFQKCSACSRVYYCSVQCQRAAWGGHKKQCWDEPLTNNRCSTMDERFSMWMSAGEILRLQDV